MIQPGDDAPAFALPDQDGREVRLADFRGAPVVVYLYPHADTPGCATQARSARGAAGEPRGGGLAERPVCRAGSRPPRGRTWRLRAGTERRAIAHGSGPTISAPMFVSIIRIAAAARSPWMLATAERGTTI